MVGYPKYKCGDVVDFQYSRNGKFGVIAIVDKYGVFEDNSEVYYDILINEENMLYKHVIETAINSKVAETDPPF